MTHDQGSGLATETAGGAFKAVQAVRPGQRTGTVGAAGRGRCRPQRAGRRTAAFRGRLWGARCARQTLVLRSDVVVGVNTVPQAALRLDRSVGHLEPVDQVLSAEEGR